MHHYTIVYNKTSRMNDIFLPDYLISMVICHSDCYLFVWYEMTELWLNVGNAAGT